MTSSSEQFAWICNACGHDRAVAPHRSGDTCAACRSSEGPCRSYRDRLRDQHFKSFRRKVKHATEPQFKAQIEGYTLILAILGVGYALTWAVFEVTGADPWAWYGLVACFTYAAALTIVLVAYAVVGVWWNDLNRSSSEGTKRSTKGGA